MLYLSTKLHHVPLLSLRSGGRIGTVIEPIINPHNLHIDGFYCQSAHSDHALVLLDIDIRDISARGIIIDNHVDLSEPEELVRLQPVLDVNFQLEAKQVLVNKKKVGKVIEYAVETQSLFIQKIYVQPRLLQSLNQNRLTFDRSNVIEVTDSYVAFSGPEVKIGSTQTAKIEGLTTDYSASTSTISE
jgi:hypothetical protein